MVISTSKELPTVIVRLAECLATYNEHLSAGEEPMTQARLARDLDVSEAAVSRWVSGQRSMSSTLAVRVARLLNCSLDDLLTSSDCHDGNWPADPTRAPQ
jgi:DNA-binding XRE family transcriptional regulator